LTSKHILDYRKKTNGNLANKRKRNFYKRWRHELRHRGPPEKLPRAPLPFNPALLVLACYSCSQVDWNCTGEIRYEL